MHHSSRFAKSLFTIIVLGALCGAARADCPGSALDARYPLSRKGDMVVDTFTRVIYMRCAYGQQWSEQAQQCTGIPHRTTGAELVELLAEARAHGWILPSYQQLKATQVAACPIPQVNGAAFPLTPPGSFWTTETLSLWLRTTPPSSPGSTPVAMTKQDYLNLLSAAVDFSAGLSREVDMTPGTGLYVRLALIPGSPEALAAGIKELWPERGVGEAQQKR